MRTKAESIIKISILLLVIAIIAGCNQTKPISSGKDCKSNQDCGGDYCSENFRKLVRQSCVGGHCVEEVTECEDSDICVQDSTGVECKPKDFDVKRNLPCTENSKNTFLDFQGLNRYNPADHICMDDCPAGFNCNADCICECPPPIFTSNYFDPPVITHDFDPLYAQYQADRGSLLDIPGTVTITAYDHVFGNVSFYIPFPEVQLILVPNPDNEYIEQYGAYCVNDYYEGERALDIDLDWYDRPEQTCIWGGKEGFEGVLTVCPEDLVRWFDAYHFGQQE
jgi:hypothetical protein